MRFLGKLILWLVLCVLFIIALLYGSDNSTPVSLVFLGWSTVAWPVAWWVIVAFLVGGIAGYVLSGTLNLKVRAEVRSLRRRLENSASELNQLRTMNLK
jgi:putative membrane protein